MGSLTFSHLLIFALFAISGSFGSLDSLDVVFRDIDNIVNGNFAALNSGKGAEQLRREIDEIVSGRFQKKNGRAFTSKGRTVPLVFLAPNKKAAKGRSSQPRPKGRSIQQGRSFKPKGRSSKSKAKGRSTRTKGRAYKGRGRTVV